MSLENELQRLAEISRVEPDAEPVSVEVLANALDFITCLESQPRVTVTPCGSVAFVWPKMRVTFWQEGDVAVQMTKGSQ